MTARAMPRSWHQLVASLAIVLFAFQSYVTQTHIHLLANALVRARSGIAQVQKPVTPNKRAPAGDPANCPICQDMALAGHFTTPAAIAVLPPAFLVLASAPVLARAVLRARPSHGWQGRAPPRH